MRSLRHVPVVMSDLSHHRAGNVVTAGAALVDECCLARAIVGRRRSLSGTNVSVPQLPGLRGRMSIWRAVRTAGGGGTISDRAAAPSSSEAADCAQGDARLDLFRHAEDDRGCTDDLAVSIHWPAKSRAKDWRPSFARIVRYGKDGTGLPWQAAQTWQGNVARARAGACGLTFQWLHYGHGFRRYQSRRVPGDGP